MARNIEGEPPISGPLGPETYLQAVKEAERIVRQAARGGLVDADDTSLSIGERLTRRNFYIVELSQRSLREILTEGRIGLRFQELTEEGIVKLYGTRASGATVAIYKPIPLWPISHTPSLIGQQERLRGGLRCLIGMEKRADSPLRSLPDLLEVVTAYKQIVGESLFTVAARYSEEDPGEECIALTGTTIDAEFVNGVGPGIKYVILLNQQKSLTGVTDFWVHARNPQSLPRGTYPPMVVELKR